MADGSEIDIPSLPIGKAADQLLHADPILGAVVIFQTAAIIFLIWWLRGVYRELGKAKDDHLEDLRVNIPTMADLNTALKRRRA